MLSITNISNSVDSNETLDSTAQQNEALGILDYGKGNAFPAQLLKMLEYSHTSNRCLDVIFKFVVGNGFVDESLNEVVINEEGERLSDLLRAHAMDVTYFEGLYTNVVHDFNTQGRGYFHMPFENSRLGEIKGGRIRTIKSNINWGLVGSTNDQEDIITYGVFNTNEEVIKKQIEEAGGMPNYFGQALYGHIKRPQKRFYPVPQYYSAQNWVKVDSKIGRFHNANVDNNFMLSVLLKVVGDPDAEYKEIKKNPDGTSALKGTGKKVGDVFNTQMKESFAGSENAGKVMVLWSKLKDQFPELESFPSNTNHDLFLALQQLTTDNLVIGFGTPRVLSNIGTAGKLGDSNEITNAVSLMQGNVRSYQALIESHYKTLFSNTSIPELQNKSFNIKPFKYEDLAGANEIIQVDENITRG